MKKVICNLENPTGIEVDLTAEELTEKETLKTEWDNGAFDRSIEKLRIDRNKLLA